MRFILCLVASGLLSAGLARDARGADERVTDLLGWVPSQTNLVLFVDVDAIRNSAIAKKEKWGSGNDAVSGLDTLPPGIARLLIASQFDPGEGVSWEVTVAGLRRPITDADLLKGTGGTLDNVGGKNVVLTPRKKFAANLSKGVVGAYQPANRQDAGRWLRAANGKTPSRLSPLLAQAGAGVTAKTPVVLVLDTSDMFAPSLVKASLSKSAALKGKADKAAALADLFGRMHCITLSISVTNALEGEIRLDFGADADEFKDLAKPILLEILTKMGLHSKEMDGWATDVRKGTVTFGGPLSKEGASGLLAPLLRPSIGSLDQTAHPMAEQTKAQATLKYYQNAQKKLREIRKSTPSDFAKLASVLNSAARHIDELPILNVDDEMLDWGASVATSMRTMAIVAQKTGGMISLAEANKAMVQVSSPNYYTGSVGGYRGGYYGGYGWGYNYAVPSGTTSTTTVSNYGQVENLQSMTSAQEADYRRNTWKSIDAATNELRRKMVKKYNVEF
jgi:hypothetical protein